MKAKQALARIAPDGDVASYRHIRDEVRALIRSGELPPGTRLPSTQELSTCWQVNVSTVQAALAPLVREGLLTRVPRRGTFVRERQEKLTGVGIYRMAEYGERSLFVEAVQAALAEELRSAGIQLQIFLSPPSVETHLNPTPTLKQAIAQREIQGLISLSGSPFNHPWMAKLSVPVSYLGGNLPVSADFDTRHMFELALRSLSDQGCRSVGMIGGWPSQLVNLYGPFTDLARDLGLTLKNEWMLVPPHSVALAHERYGYEQFDFLWRGPERPEGLIVDPDSIARGVITRLLEQRVKIPEELKLVIHKNESIKLLCPMPATFLVSSERELARALVLQIQKQFRGEPTEPIILPYRLTAHGG